MSSTHFQDLGPEYGILGTLLDTPTRDHARLIPDGALVIRHGKISDCGPRDTVQTKPENQQLAWVQRPTPTALAILPGLIDLHAHIPQYLAVARRESGVLPWLDRHIFPIEKNFQGEAVRPFLREFFHEMASHGITTSMLYAAVWQDSCDLAFEAARDSGHRAIIGKVMMDRQSYGSLNAEAGPDQSLRETEELIEKWHRAEEGRLEYAVSPRYALSCSMALMEGAAGLARKHGTFIQTHLSENHDEIAQVEKLFPDARDYAEVYRHAGLLTEKTILGHCLHLSGRELRELADSGARIAHCPTSNFFLNSGLFPMDRIAAAGIPFGLGSDFAGGPEANPWQVMRSAIETQKARHFFDDRIEELTPTAAYFHATKGAALALGKENAIGSLDPGHDADLSIVDLRKALPLSGKFEMDGAGIDTLTADEILSLLIYRGNSSIQVATTVRGNVTFSNDS